MVNFLFISDEFLSAHSLLGGRGLTESWRRERDRWLVLRVRAGAQPRTVTGYYNLWPCEPSEMRSEAGAVQCAVMGHCTPVQCITYSTGCNGGDLCSDPGQHREKCAHWRSDNNSDNYSPRLNLPSHKFSLFECLQNHKNKIFRKIIIISPASVKRCQELIQYILLEISTFNIPS